MELIIFSAIEGLQAEVEQLRDVAVLAPSRIDQVQRLLTGARPPDAIYIDDSRGTPLAELWDITARAQQVGARVMLGLAGPARSALPDALAAGIPATGERNPAVLADWIGAQIGRRRGSGVQRLPVIAIGAAKGGIGKTFATCVLAEGLRRRGLDVLVWDSDISNPGLVPAFRIPASAPSYLHLVQRGIRPVFNRLFSNLNTLVPINKVGGGSTFSLVRMRLPVPKMISAYPTGKGCIRGLSRWKAMMLY